MPCEERGAPSGNAPRYLLRRTSSEISCSLANWKIKMQNPCRAKK
jgi:hypothetical protein